MTCICENCKRSQLELEVVAIDEHVANLCLMCAYLFKQNSQRLKQLVQGQTGVQANDTMKQQHKKLSMLLTCGVVCLTVLGTLGVIEQINAAEVQQTLTFLELKRL